ncbi:uncharacterized protein LOC111255833 [Setaria italica]|uniref:uncharacterized protein LOC111255833 n=1 Tax=Setaria italica TaxID=4555 RepID=UPI000BE4D7DF|nr:uncharacterized protein LOC111255833 [Setaria italica]
MEGGLESERETTNRWRVASNRSGGWPSSARVWIPHLWRDEECVKILKNCHRALPANGKVIVIEYVLPASPEPTLAAQGAFHLDVVMLNRLAGAKERTERGVRRDRRRGRLLRRLQGHLHLRQRLGARVHQAAALAFAVHISAPPFGDIAALIFSQPAEYAQPTTGHTKPCDKKLKCHA